MSEIRPTIHTVAEEAGVGVGTVSRVLNNHPSVRDSTRERVLAAIAKLDYNPSPQTPRGGRKQVARVGLVLPSFSSPCYQAMLPLLETSLQRHDLGLCVWSGSGAAVPEEWSEAVGPLMGGLLAGLLLADPAAFAGWAAPAAKQRTYRQATHRQTIELPTVWLGSYAAELDCAYIDHGHGGRLAADYVASLGHPVLSLWSHAGEPVDLGSEAKARTMDLSSSAQLQCGDFVSPDVQRQIRRGFEEGLAGQGVPSTAHVFQSDLSLPRQVRDALQTTYQQHKCITVMAHSDAVAAEVLAQAQALDLNVGSDIFVMGYGDLNMAAPLGLSTVHAPLADLTEAAVALLLENLEAHSQKGRKSRRGKSKQEVAVTAPNSRRLEPRLALRGTA